MDFGEWLEKDPESDLEADTWYTKEEMWDYAHKAWKAAKSDTEREE